MIEHKEQIKPTKTIPSARDVMDAEYMTNGDGFGRKWTREELDIQQRIGDLLDAKLAAGYSIEEINSEWEGKTPQEILSNR